MLLSFLYPTVDRLPFVGRVQEVVLGLEVAGVCAPGTLYFHNVCDPDNGPGTVAPGSQRASDIAQPTLKSTTRMIVDLLLHQDTHPFLCPFPLPLLLLLPTPPLSAAIWKLYSPPLPQAYPGAVGC